MFREAPLQARPTVGMSTRFDGAALPCAAVIAAIVLLKQENNCNRTTRDNEQRHQNGDHMIAVDRRTCGAYLFR